MPAVLAQEQREDWTFAEFAGKYPEAARRMAPRGVYRDYHVPPIDWLPWYHLYGIQGFVRAVECPVFLRGSREHMYSRHSDLDRLLARMVRGVLAWDGLTIVYHDVAQRYLQRVHNRILAHFTDYSSEYHFVRRIQDGLRSVLGAPSENVGVDRGAALFDDENRLTAPILLNGRLVTDLDVALGRGVRARTDVAARFLRLLDKSSRADLEAQVDAERSADAERKRVRHVEHATRQRASVEQVKRTVGGVPLPKAAETWGFRVVNAFGKGMRARWNGEPRSAHPYAIHHGRGVSEDWLAALADAWRRGWRWGGTRRPDERIDQGREYLDRCERAFRVKLPKRLASLRRNAIGAFMVGACARWDRQGRDTCPYAAPPSGCQTGGPWRSLMRAWHDGWNWAGVHRTTSSFRPTRTRTGVQIKWPTAGTR